MTLIGNTHTHTHTFSRQCCSGMHGGHGITTSLLSCGWRMLLCNVAWACQGSSIKRRLLWISGIHLGIKNKCLCTKWLCVEEMLACERTRKGQGKERKNTSKIKRPLERKKAREKCKLFSVYQIRLFLVNSCYYHGLIGYLVFHLYLMVLKYALEMFQPFPYCLFLQMRMLLHRWIAS